MIAAAILDAILIPTDEGFAQEYVYDDPACPNYALLDSNPGSWLAKEHMSPLRFGRKRLLLLVDEAWRYTPYPDAL